MPDIPRAPRLATNDHEKHLAVLIDGDNVSAKVIAGLMAEVANYGTASVRRIYGDWTSPQMKSWRECLLEFSIAPMQQFAYTTGKNATDGAMIIDAMDLLYTNRFSSFCLVSSDSDFTGLASRIRAQGISVYGFGNRNTCKAFVAACNEFVYFDALSMHRLETDETLSTPTSTDTAPSNGPLGLRSAPPTGPRALYDNKMPTSVSEHQYATQPQLNATKPLSRNVVDSLALAIQQSTPDNEEFANLAHVGDLLIKISPEMTPRNFGFPRLRSFVEASGIAEVKMEARDPTKSPIALVRLTSWDSKKRIQNETANIGSRDRLVNDQAVPS